MKTNKQWRRMPFDIELAKKIQSGEIEGRIVTFYCGNPVRIITYDLQGSYEVVYAEQGDDKEVVGVCNRDGIGYADVKALVIELPEETPICNNPDSPKCKTCSNWHCNNCQYNKREFKPFDKVLVRDYDNDMWNAALFSHLAYDEDDSKLYYTTSGFCWAHCIPYEGNQDLVGITKNPE